MRNLLNCLKGIVAGSVAALALSAEAGTVTYFHNDLLGSPVVATNASGQVIWRETYRPYGERLTNDANSASNKVWYTSRRHDVESGLVYMGARYYDPAVGRFMGVDPKLFDDSNIHSFNRYAYGNNNPYRYVDPTGAAGESFVIRGLIGIAGALGIAGMQQTPEHRARNVRATQDALRGLFGLTAILAESANEGGGPGEGDKQGKSGSTASGGNSNPYQGPVGDSVIVVDQHGNAMPVGRGEKITTSPNGDYQQVRGQDGEPTGIRLDRGGHRTHSDPRAQSPHGHRPGVTTPEGNPHLPIKE